VRLPFKDLTSYIKKNVLQKQIWEDFAGQYSMLMFSTIITPNKTKQKKGLQIACVSNPYPTVYLHPDLSRIVCENFTLVI